MKFDFRSVASKRGKNPKLEVATPIPQPSAFDFGDLERPAAPAQPEPINVLTWAKKYRRLKGHPFTLRNHMPLEQVYEDDHPYQVFIKPAQVGVSELAVTKAVHALDVGAAYYALDTDGLNVGYLFPTREALYDFSKERISSLKGEHPHLNILFSGEFDNTGFKQCGNSYLYVRGAWSEHSLISFPADLLIFDEYDRMDPKAAALAEARLLASFLRHKLYISTPTVEGVGVHALYLQSDQQRWEVPCACGQWIEMDFFRDVHCNGEPHEEWKHWELTRIRRAEITVRCPACRQALNRTARGRWRATAPENDAIRGYWIPRLAFPVTDLTYLCTKAVDPDPDKVQEFFRSDLGIPYQPGGSRVTDAILQMLSHKMRGGILPVWNWRNTTMGIDVGGRYHYRISSTGPEGETYVRAMGTVGSWEECDTLMERYAVRRCVVDALPEQHGSQAFALRHPGKVFCAFYPSERALRGKLFDLKEEERVVNVNRTMAMDAVYNALAGGKEHWPAEIHNADEVRANMKAPVRVETKDAQGQPQVAWVHSSPDHFYHACVYDRIARESLPKPVMGVLAQATASGWNPN